MKTSYKYILTPTLVVGWYLSGKAVFSLNVYTNMASWPPLSHKKNSLMNQTVCDIGILPSPNVNLKFEFVHVATYVQHIGTQASYVVRDLSLCYTVNNESYVGEKFCAFSTKRKNFLYQFHKLE